MSSISDKQRKHLELTVSSGSPTHPFVVALARLLSGESVKGDGELVIATMKAEPHWAERNAALAALLDVKLEDIVPPIPAAPTVEGLLAVIADLRAKLGEKDESKKDESKKK